MTPDLVLSLFSGVGMLDAAFREQGYCVVSAGDVTWGSLYDIRAFSPPAGVFAGVIGGPPCQMWSSLAHLVRANGHEPRFGNLIPEFERVVGEALPEWWLMENVPHAPEPAVDGYECWPRLLNNRWFDAEQNRVRRFTIGLRSTRGLDPWRFLEVGLFEPALSFVAVKGDPGPTRREARAVISGNGFDSGSVYYQRQNQAALTSRDPVPVKIGGSGKVKRTAGAVTASDGAGKVKMVRYGLADACELQGLPRDFLADAPFTAQGKLKAVANGVPLPMGRAVVKAVRQALGAQVRG